MDHSAVIRQLVALRTRDRVADADIARMSAAQLRTRPEATIAGIVHGWFEFRSNGYAEADVCREIEARRTKAYGEEPLPVDLNLGSYTRYRMRLEHPRDTALHDPLYVMQAVHVASKAFEREYGPAGQPTGMRGLPWGHMGLLVYAGFIGFFQGIPNAAYLLAPRPRPATEAWLSGPLLVLAVAVVAGVLAYGRQVKWGRAALQSALAAEIAGGWIAAAYLVAWDRGGPPAVLMLQAVNTLLAAACLAYVHRRERASRPPPATARDATPFDASGAAP